MVDKNQYSQEGLSFLGKMERPIAGQSLTNSPESKYAWEQPPKFVEMQPALDSMFLDLTEPDAYEAIVNLVDDGNSIADISQIILYAGFEEGLYNPDLMMLLIEPSMYLIMSLVEKAGRLDYTILKEDDEDYEEPSEEEISYLENILNKSKKKVDDNKKSVKLPSNLTDKIKNVEVPESLLAKSKTEEDVE
jgi:hypothetical protein